ncbi:hypothetical protein BU24DRAFT_132841 [Aaosphaeria arxii CBS 175.79]|uniref:C2H2 type master regulator of conidiophore development brlA n=1 Tax=Aaosphaeria arxii CBS 175.79 TaxID=1450172 RepID=A0A6A5Y3K9_9PLEO|nr:uncharacterized protein BU24DRAFT_132841 [Aaosphaeria arxii CBS 175.79]KAF2020058.1 hypothetical protein BU24DRAFT_132841 [Aaosphaeria arxii CBS 175.79]
MSIRDQPTPPFNSPYQHAMKPTSLLQSPAYPSPARSECEPSHYPAEGLGLHGYQYYPASGAPSSAVLYPPSPQPTEAWSHLSTGASPLISEPHAESWNSTYDTRAERSPLPWGPQHPSHRSSLSSARDVSIYSREDSEHGFPHIKLEHGNDWAEEERSTPALRNAAMTVSPEHLTTGMFPHEHVYRSPSLTSYEASAIDGYESREYDSVHLDGRTRSPDSNGNSNTSTARTRVRRNPTTRDNANHSCHVCGKLFQRSYNHKSHLETHNPDRKKEHICQVEDCGKKFVRKTDLDRHHNSVHRKLKKFRCCKCDASFARKDTLRRHEEDGCPRRNVLPRTRSVRSSMPYYPGSRSELYDSRSPQMFRDQSYVSSPNSF